MARPILVCGVLAAVGLGVGLAVQAGSVVHPNGKPIMARGIPKPVRAAVNAQQRVYACSRDGETLIYFQGATKHLNAFLTALAKTKDARLGLVLTHEKGLSRKLLARLDGEGPDAKTVRWDWNLRLYKPLLREGDGPLHRAKRPWIIVTVSLAGDINLDKLALPVAYRASVGGRTADFVKGHNQRRADIESAEKPPTKPAPTTMSLLKQAQGFE